jgi:NAD(P)-dependent dehydrogenase (short-subunit alcohol dehydrogenase family)
MKINGSNILITGASRGLGAALARELSRRGGRLALVARDPAPLQRLAAELQAAGGTAHPLAHDVGDKQAVYALAGAAQALLGPLDILIHNASTLGPVPLRLLLDTECEELEQVLAVNLVGPFRLSKAVAGGMVLRGRGLLLHISSDAAVTAYPRWGAYGVSKAALDHLARTFAAELEGTGVRSLILDPGEMDTQMHRDAMPDADPGQLARPEEVAARIAAMIERAEAIPNGARLIAAEMGS